MTKYLENKIKEILPEIRDKAMKDLINMIYDTCSSCHEADASCQCWNDE